MQRSEDLFESVEDLLGFGLFLRRMFLSIYDAVTLLKLIFLLNYRHAHRHSII